jgi:flagellin-like protein
MKFMKNEDAVSPVIGVILMVAITVILAAVIAAFVFGMAGNIQKTKVVAATAAQPSSTLISITFQGGQDAATFNYANVTLTSSCSAFTYNPNQGAFPLPGKLGNQVGCQTQISCGTGDFGGRDHVVVAGVFTDGSMQVILDTYV